MLGISDIGEIIEEHIAIDKEQGLPTRKHLLVEMTIDTLADSGTDITPEIKKAVEAQVDYMI